MRLGSQGGAGEFECDIFASFSVWLWDYKYDNTPENVKKMSLDYEKEDRCSSTVSGGATA